MIECNNPEASFAFSTVLKTDVQALKIAIDSKTNGSVDENCHAFTQAVESIQVGSSECETNLTACLSEKAQLTTDLETCISEKAVLETNVTNLNNQVTQLNDDLQNCTNSKDELQTQLTACTSAKTQLEEDIVTLNSQITTLTNNLNTCTTDKQAIQDNLDTCIADKATLQTAFNNANETIVNLNAQIVDLNNQITSKNAEIATLTARVSELEDLTTRPKEWLDMPEIDLTVDDKIVGLFHIVGDADYDEIAFECTSNSNGNITVDWGDGTVETVAGGTILHTYDFNTINSDLTAEGYNQCVVTITAENSTIKTFKSYTKNSLGNYSVGFSDLIMSIRDLVTLYLYKALRLRFLEISDLNSITTLTSSLRECSLLESVKVGNTPLLNSIAYMCRTTRIKHFVIGNTPLLNNATQAFYGASILSLEIGDTALTNNSLMMYDAQGLKKLKMGTTATITSDSLNFNRLFSLEKIELTDSACNLNLSSSNLSRDAIINLFNSLATVTDKTITLTAVRGAGQLTDEDKLIATNKGYTIVI